MNNKKKKKNNNNNNSNTGMHTIEGTKMKKDGKLKKKIQRKRVFFILL